MNYYSSKHLSIIYTSSYTFVDNASRQLKRIKIPAKCFLIDLAKIFFSFYCNLLLIPNKPPVSFCSLSKDKHVLLRWANLMQYTRLMGRLFTVFIWELQPWLQIYRSCQASKLTNRWVASKVIDDPWPHVCLCKQINTFAQMHK